MDWLWVLLGLGLGVVLTLLFMRRPQQRQPVDTQQLLDARLETERTRISQIYERRIVKLQADHEEALAYVRQLSVNRSRAVLKGKMAEQMAPMLPGFNYLPADSRFLGDPIDYVIFNGYTSTKDNHEGIDDLEVVLVDIKQGKSGLSYGQRQIARAVANGRVRFEVVRVLPDGTIHTHDMSLQPGLLLEDT